MRQGSINLSFPVTLFAGEGSFCYVDDVDGISYHCCSEPKARRKLKEGLRQKIDDLLDDDRSENKRRWIIGCGDGTIILVERGMGSWGYSICGEGRKHSSYSFGSMNFIDTRESARRHADSGYGGISWEHWL